MHPITLREMTRDNPLSRFEVNVSPAHTAVFPPRVAKLLDKLRQKWRIEAISLMLLTNDHSEEFARSLVGATPSHGAIKESRKRVYGADQKILSSLVRERDELLRTAIPAISHLGRNSIDLVIVEGFVRRLLAMPDVAKRLKAGNRQAYRMLCQEMS